MIAPSNGLVIRYNYLWARQFDRREESGRFDKKLGKIAKAKLKKPSGMKF
jgi:hypothetical protein